MDCTLSDSRCDEGLSDWLCDSAKAQTVYSPPFTEFASCSLSQNIACASYLTFFSSSHSCDVDQDDRMSSLGGTGLSSMQMDSHTAVGGHGISSFSGGLAFGEMDEWMVERVKIGRAHV